MPGTAPLSLKQVDPVLRHASDSRMQRLALVIAGISFVGVSLFYAVVALCIRLEQQEFCRKCTSSR
jgi:hypothetical protein